MDIPIKSKKKTNTKNTKKQQLKPVIVVPLSENKL